MEKEIQERMAEKLADFWRFYDFPNGKPLEAQGLEALALVAVQYLEGKI